MKSSGTSIRMIVTAAMCAAAFAVLAQIAIPLPSGIPLTLQTFAAALCGYVLHWKWGLASVATYLLLGAAGLPVFANFRGGASVLIGMTGGFLWGFLPLTALCGAGADRDAPWQQALFGLLGLIVCHLAGVIQFALLTGRTAQEAFLLSSLPYLLKDALSVLAACLVARYLRKRRIIS